MSLSLNFCLGISDWTSQLVGSQCRERRPPAKALHFDRLKNMALYTHIGPNIREWVRMNLEIEGNILLLIYMLRYCWLIKVFDHRQSAIGIIFLCICLAPSALWIKTKKNQQLTILEWSFSCLPQIEGAMMQGQSFWGINYGVWLEIMSMCIIGTLFVCLCCMRKFGWVQHSLLRRCRIVCTCIEDSSPLTKSRVWHVWAPRGREL